MQQEGWQLDCWQHEAMQELVQAGGQQGLDTQLTGVQTRVRQGAGAQQLGVQHGGSQQLSGQSFTCQQEPVQGPGRQGRCRSSGRWSRQMGWTRPWRGQWGWRRV